MIKRFEIRFGFSAANWRNSKLQRSFYSECISKRVQILKNIKLGIKLKIRLSFLENYKQGNQIRGFSARKLQDKVNLLMHRLWYNKTIEKNYIIFISLIA